MSTVRQSLDQFVRHYLLAVQSFTRVPVRGSLADWIGFTPDMLRASAPHLPGVGWLVGMAACVTFAVLSLALPDGPQTPLAAAVGCTIATVLLTGAVHEKSLAALLGGPLALMLAFLAKMTVLAVLAVRSPGGLLTALLAAHTVSRFWPLVLVHTLPHVGSAGLGERAFADRLERRALGVGAAWCVVPLALMALAHGLPFIAGAVAVSGIALWATRYWLQRTLRGFNADSLGAAQQVCEIAFYFGAAFGLSSR